MKRTYQLQSKSNSKSYMPVITMCPQLDVPIEIVIQGYRTPRELSLLLKAYKRKVGKEADNTLRWNEVTITDIKNFNLKEPSNTKQPTEDDTKKYEKQIFEHHTVTPYDPSKPSKTRYGYY
jgi:hypothetical protein